MVLRSRVFEAKLFRSILVLAGIALATAVGTPAQTQNLGLPPTLGLNRSDLCSAFHVSVPDAVGSPAGDAATQLQVGVRARRLGLSLASAVTAWEDAQT